MLQRFSGRHLVLCTPPLGYVVVVSFFPLFILLLRCHGYLVLELMMIASCLPVAHVSGVNMYMRLTYIHTYVCAYIYIFFSVRINSHISSFI